MRADACNAQCGWIRGGGSGVDGLQEHHLQFHILQLIYSACTMLHSIPLQLMARLITSLWWKIGDQRFISRYGQRDTVTRASKVKSNLSPLPKDLISSGLAVNRVLAPNMLRFVRQPSAHSTASTPTIAAPNPTPSVCAAPALLLAEDALAAAAELAELADDVASAELDEEAEEEPDVVVRVEVAVEEPLREDEVAVELAPDLQDAVCGSVTSKGLQMLLAN